MGNNQLNTGVKKGGNNTPGIMSLVISIIAVIGCWIPGLNIISMFLAVISGIIAVISLISAFRNKSGSKLLPISGIIISLFSIFFGSSMNNYMFNSSSSSTSSSSNTSSTSESSENNNSNTSENKEVEKSQYAVGDVIKFDDKEVTITNVKRNYSTGNEFSKPKSGNEFIKVSVKIDNKSKDTVSVNTFDFKVQDSNGVIDDCAAPTYSLDDGLESSQLASEGSKTGSMIFEVPKNDSNLILIYQPSFLSNKKIEIKL